VAGIQQAITEGADPNSAAFGAITPLFDAVAAKDADAGVVSALVGSMSTAALSWINVADGGNALHAAIDHGCSISVLEVLLAALPGPAFGATCEGGETVLHRSARSTQEIFDAVLAKAPTEVVVAMTTESGATALHLLAEAGLDCAGFMAKCGQQCIDATDGSGRTALHAACNPADGVLKSDQIRGLIAEMSRVAVDACDVDGKTAFYCYCDALVPAEVSGEVIGAFVASMSQPALAAVDNFFSWTACHVLEIHKAVPKEMIQLVKIATLGEHGRPRRAKGLKGRMEAVCFALGLSAFPNIAAAVVACNKMLSIKTAGTLPDQIDVLETQLGL
jgi:hypothetical protein